MISKLKKTTNLNLTYSFEHDRESAPRVITNKSDDFMHVVALKSFKRADREFFHIKSHAETIYGKPAELKVVNSNMKVLDNCTLDGNIIFNEATNGRFRLAITIPPRSSVKIRSFAIESTNDPAKSIEGLLDGRTVVLSPGYPSVDNKYSHAFIHTRVRRYIKNGEKIDVIVVNDQIRSSSRQYEFEGIRITELGYGVARSILQERKYSKILVHFFDEKYAQILDAVDTNRTNIYIYAHGSDALYWDYPKIFKRYFEKPPEINSELMRLYSSRDALIKRYSSKDNVTWIFGSNFAKNTSEDLIGISFERVNVIPSLVDEKIFKFKKRSPESRKKICIIRKFDNLSSYSIDISTRVILELSKRPFFKDLEINIYGDGDYHGELLAPIASLDNVRIHRKFLSHQEMNSMYSEHGIALFPSRYDTQGAAACEAAMTGAVVISSDGDIGTKEYIDPKLGTYCKTEDIKEYADLIEKLYNNEPLFLELSEQMRESVMDSCSSKASIDREMKILFSKDNPAEGRSAPQIKPKTKSPVLSIVVPSYNVERYLTAGIMSLLDSPLAHKTEIIIVNDGSKDSTAEIGKYLERLSKTKSGSIVRLIDKENGGHGSTINAGIKAATGKYFRLMDGDDYFVTQDYTKLIELLEKEESDIVLTNYIEDFAPDGVKNVVRHYDFMTPGVKYSLEDMNLKNYGFGKWGPLLSTTTCKTSILKEANFPIDENCFYVDMEYNFIIYAEANDVVYYPLDIYNYFLGRQGQSISKESFKRNVSHHEKVCIRLADEYSKRGDSISAPKKEYLLEKLIIPVCKSQYMITTEYYSTRGNFLSFDKKLTNYPSIYNDARIAGRITKLHRLTNGVLIPLDSVLKSASSSLRKIKQRVVR